MSTTASENVPLLIVYIFRPSTTKDAVIDNSHLEYLKAQQFGNTEEPCGHIYKECSISILDNFSGIYSEAMDLIKEFMS